MLKRFTPAQLALALLISFFSASGLVAQTTANGQARTAIKQSPARPAKPFQLTSELKQQQKFLQNVASRFEAVSVYDFTPLLSYTYVWNALRENRTRIVDPRRGLNADQVRLIKAGYELLETDVVLRFLDHQLSVLDETLQLEESQYEQVEKILSADIQQKRILLSTPGINSKQFIQRLLTVSHESEKNLLSVLTAEQQKNFYKQIGLTRDRLIA